MRLHKNKEQCEVLSQIVSRWKNIPIEAIKRDYLIVMILQKLASSDYMNQCVFKGGTSLSKCYPGTIERFSEDIDLTFLDIDLSDNQKDKVIKNIEKILWEDMKYEKIAMERSKNSKSSYIWIDEIGESNKIKLEIGSSIRPEPSKILTLKTYYQEYFEENDLKEEIEHFQLKEVNINVLDITRTFLDKVLAVKRHAYNKDLLRKVRHIYDVVKLYENEEVQEILNNKEELKKLLEIIKNTDMFYVGKRKNHVEDYCPDSNFQFDEWIHYFDTKEIRNQYESLHLELLYTDETQSFSRAIEVFKEIDNIFKEIEER